MTRYVREINSKPRASTNTETRPFHTFAATANIVLLGDPGAGKTHLFREAAIVESGRYITVREFLNAPEAELRDSTLFIDALDEKRSGRGDSDIVDRLVTKLFSINPTKVRIACRVVDWLGDSDLTALQPFFNQNGETSVLILEKLSTQEQIAVLLQRGFAIDDAAAFVQEPTQRGLNEFLENPQNLIMLADVVREGSWPTTRTDLFELSTALMLAESNKEHARTGSGVYSVAELRLVAGAACAASLISDVDAISLRDDEGTDEIPSYRSIDLYPREKVQAALGRRVFEANGQPEAVAYAHRTVAEFLAAQFLAHQVRAGLPFGRVKALIGVDGHPATELRGLHAWLTIHLPEYADDMISADPYGVLTYGDSASLTKSSCQHLIRSLGQLSQENPRFRSGGWQSPSIGALARPDMVNEFRAILDDPNSGFGVRSVIIDALAFGTPLPEMILDLAGIVARYDGTNAVPQLPPYAERSRAVEALLRMEKDAYDALRKAFSRLGIDANDIRLRSKIVTALYAAPYGPDDVIRIANDTLRATGAVVTGLLWTIPERLPEHDLAVVLDGIANDDDEQASYRALSEVGTFYGNVMKRALASDIVFAPARVLIWLLKSASLGRQGGQATRNDVVDMLKQRPELLRAMAVTFFSGVPINDHSWIAYSRFREAMHFAIDGIDLVLIIIDQLGKAKSEVERYHFLYRIALLLCYEAGPIRGRASFEHLCALADEDVELLATREGATATQLPETYSHHRRRTPEDPEISREKQRREFDLKRHAIRSGQDVNWLLHIARIYFGAYSDIERGSSPRERLAEFLGQERVPDALTGLMHALTRADIPSFAKVLSILDEGKIFGWGLVIIAGVCEKFAAQQDLSSEDDDFLKMILAIDLADPIPDYAAGGHGWLVHDWRSNLLQNRTELAKDVYVAVAKSRISQNVAYAGGLRELLTDPLFEQGRADIVLDLLGRYPCAHTSILNELLAAAAQISGSATTLVRLAQQFLADPGSMDQEHADLWLAVAYALSPATYEQSVEQRASEHNAFIFALRDRCGYSRNGPQKLASLPLGALEFLATLTGSLFPEAPIPLEGGHGDQNGWNASEFFHGLANMISTSPTSEATLALERMTQNEALKSYKPHVLSALANQRLLRRSAEYERPDWRKTVTTLGNGAPATTADLHAYLVETLQGLAHRIARDNTDIFKQFWNIDSSGRLVEPRPEEACRDDLLTLMRPLCVPFGIRAEPEGHMVADKRADISVTMPGRKILCELKRDYHRDVWTAPVGQLERFYTPDPEAKGFGIYGVFWFGRPNLIRAPPNGLERPASAAEMLTMLEQVIPENFRARLAVVVFDVSGKV